ncbi:hypothetical protein Cni_G10122 [Canna indica]|uniref:Uncharacterized protein n=1 Tax=Canna indica TaxID=4628 RepID=A0AAQ3K9C2_9LILI|nr:hypothetical protein Cni_G10122 [Canna indica]
MNSRHIPAFGSWDYCDDLPITQYFESAMHGAGEFRGRSFGEDHYDDLFIPQRKPAYRRHQKKAKRGGGEKPPRSKQMGKVCDEAAQATAGRPRSAGKAVDEDLYKIPPELLSQKPKRKRLLRGLWSGCLGIDCVA